jgi:hypothetical protein
VITELGYQYNTCKEEVISLFLKAKNVALTLDIWLDRRMKGYLGETGNATVDHDLITKLLCCK